MRLWAKLNCLLSTVFKGFNSKRCDYEKLNNLFFFENNRRFNSKRCDYECFRPLQSNTTHEFQFQKVRLWGRILLSNCKTTNAVSIPKGAIMSCFSWKISSWPYCFNSKRCDYEARCYWYYAYNYAVSIPKGAIMSNIASIYPCRTFVSIPKGAIMSITELI